MTKPVPTLVTLAVAALFYGFPVAAQLAQPNGSGVAWGHIHLNVTDLDRHAQIWVQHFGGVQVDLDLVSTIRLPATIIMLNERAPTGGTQGSGIDHFGFSVPDLASFLERWRTSGLEVANEFEGAGGVPQAYVTMPDGIRIELQEVPTLGVPAEPYHVHLYTGDGAEEQRDWYADLFSMEPRRRGTIPYTADVPGINVSFTDAPDGVAATRGRAIDHIGFEINGLESFVKDLEARGVVFDVPYRVIEELGVAIAFFTDVSGVRVELTEGRRQY